MCNRTESVEHFLLHCIRFTEARRTMLNVVLAINNVNFGRLQSNNKIKLLLYGDISLGNVVNKLLIKATINFLRDSERFL